MLLGNVLAVYSEQSAILVGITDTSWRTDVMVPRRAGHGDMVLRQGFCDVALRLPCVRKWRKRTPGVCWWWQGKQVASDREHKAERGEEHKESSG